MKNLYIIGARGFGREVYNLFLECKDGLGDVECKGFLDDKYDALDGYEGYPPIVSSVEEYFPKKHDVFICALGDVAWKRHYIEILLHSGARFISLIHPNVTRWTKSSIGCGCIIFNNCHISCDVSIGNFVTLLTGSVIGHDVKVGDFGHLGAMTFMGGFSTLKERVTLHTASIILPRKVVEEDSVVGAQSVVIKNVPKGVTVYGNPARKIEF